MLYLSGFPDKYCFIDETIANKNQITVMYFLFVKKGNLQKVEHFLIKLIDKRLILFKIKYFCKIKNNLLNYKFNE